MVVYMLKNIFRKKTLTIRFQILFVCLFSMLIMQLLLIFNYNHFKEMKITTNSNYFSDLISQMSESVELNCSYLNGMVENIAYSNDVQNYLSTEDKSYIKKHYNEVKDFITPFADINDGIKDIAVIGTSNKYVNLNADINDLQKIIPEIPEKALWYYTGQHDIRMIPYKKYKYFVIGANVYSTSDFTRKDKIGTILITFNMKSIFGFGQNQKNEELPEMLIYDRKNQLAYSSVTSKDIETSYKTYFDKNGTGIDDVITQNTESYYIKTGRFESLNGKIVFLIPKAELMKGMDKIRIQTFIIFLVILIFMIILSLIVTNNIVIPIKQFMDYLKKVGHGDLRMMKQPINLNGAAEIIVMSEEFNKMMEEINDLSHRLVKTSTRLYESELAKRQAELEFMYSQINPHFLFNTLETIKGCAVDEDANKTFQMINSLGTMFRYCVRSGNVVSIREEVNVINSYMLLQKNRFGAKLNFICNINEELNAAAIPKMILQPLIENAVIHGIEDKGAITVWLEGSIINNIICINISDDGSGISPTQRNELIKNMNDITKTKHIGISNVNKRIKYIYGDEYGIEIKAADGQGFSVCIRFPYEKMQPHDQSGVLND